jgi:hypothetical protein
MSKRSHSREHDFWDVMPWALHYTTSSLHSCLHSWLYDFVIDLFFLADMLKLDIAFIQFMLHCLYICIYVCIYVYVDWYVKARHMEMEDLSMVGM